jgi:glycosyltransferase involved in cell wall biosynthesis
VRLLFAGALIPTKGPHLLLEAFARLPAGAATLALAGPRVPLDLDPDYTGRLQARVAGLPGARLLPPFPPGGAQAFLAQGDVLVVPSLWEENSPLVVREARAAGLRVVASRRGGIPEIAPAARFFDPEVPGSLAAALAAEVRAGRRRDPPATWDGPVEQARRLLDVLEHRVPTGKIAASPPVSG